jgi:branched-chain amino acid transport system substrate-binding protein
LPLEKMPGGKAFAEKYTAKFSMEIQLWAPYAYDAARAMFAAMKKANSADPGKYLPALTRLSYPGVTGTIAFDEKGDLRDGSITLYQVKAGRWQVLETVGGAEP